MCYRTTCSSCGKPSYGGCGRHVESVLGDIPPEARCRCRAESPPKNLATVGGMLGSWIARTVGRSS